MRTPLGLFDAYGIEIEYMIVDDITLDVKPIADKVLFQLAGVYAPQLAVGELTWSNELAAHLLELKVTDPAPTFAGVAALFDSGVGRVNDILAEMGARLLPGGMHPWMDPARESGIWEHDGRAIYETLDRMFDVRRHGWLNLQSTHLNLPFSGDEEFGRLHAAVRLLLPIMPALAASSPVFDGKLAGALDARLEHYLVNQEEIPFLVAGGVPEPVYTRKEYGEIIARIEREIAVHDPARVLRAKWVNSRYAIPRFDRDTVEIRILDAQECPKADIGIGALIASVLRSMTNGRWIDVETQKAWPTKTLREIAAAVIKNGGDALMFDPEYLRAFGQPTRAPMRARDLWGHLFDAHKEDLAAADADAFEGIRTIVEKGCLAARIVDRLGPDPSPTRIKGVWRELSECLAAGAMYGE